VGTNRVWRCLLAVALLLTPAELWGQERQITGRVLGAETGGPVSGADISVIGQAIYGTVLTGEDGRFAMRVPTGEVRLQVRAFGYSRVEVTVGAGQNTVDVSLSQDVFRLGEVVVTG